MLTECYNNSMSWKNDQVSAEETTTILKAAEKTLTTPGDWVEFGCYKGDTSLSLANILHTHHSDKHLWLYDSFEGLPTKTQQDQPEVNPEFQPGSLATSKRELKLRFLRANLPLPIIKKAWFADLAPDGLPIQISFAFLDSDFYESIKTSLELIVPRLTPNAVIVIHDYHNAKLPGVARAVDELIESKSSLSSQKLILL